MLKQCFPSVWSDGDPASGRSKMKETACTGLWLRPVGVHRTRPVMIPGVLDLMESTGRWVAVSGRCHRSIRSIGNMRDLDSFFFPNPIRRGAI